MADDAAGPGGGNGTGRRTRWLVAGAVVGVVALVATLVVLIGGGGSDGGPPLAVPGDGAGCDIPAEIRPLSVAGPPDWRKLELPAERRCFTLAAARSDAGGVAPDSAFVLESTEPFDALRVPERLVVDPPLAFEPVTGTAPTRRVELRPAEPLAPDTVYRFTLLDRPGGQTVDRWSFQSQAPLRVVATLPADGATGVPLDTGIELTFSHDGAEGVADRLEIAPEIEGRFETHKRTAVFVPKNLRPGTLYTVTLQPGVTLAGTGESITEPVVFRFETGTEARGGPQQFLSFSRDVWESPSAEAPALAVIHAGNPTPERLAVEVHRYPDRAAFLAALDGLARIPPWAMVARRSHAASADGTTEVATFEAGLEAGAPGGERFIRFPEALPAGHYVVRARSGDLAAQAFLQVTDLAAYVALSERATLVWVNDIAAGAPVAGARVAVAGGEEIATTGADGVARFDTPPALLGVADDDLGERAAEVADLVVTAGGRSAVVPLSVTVTGNVSFAFRQFEFPGNPGGYWRFLVTDRKLYRPTDTVNLWGFVRPREGTLAAGERVVVRMRGYDDQGPVRVARTTLDVGPSGTFLGSLALSGVSPGYYQVEAEVGGQTVGSTWVDVRDFVTPAYQLDVVPSAGAAFAGDDVRYDITASFAEGTPVPGVRLRVAQPGPAELTTDAAGRATYVHKAGTGQEIYGAHTVDNVTVTPAVPEEGEIAGSAQVLVFAGAVVTTSQAAVAGTEGVVTGTAHEVDLAAAARQGGFGDHRGGPAVGRTVNAEVTETRYEAVEIGEYYDFVAKIVRKRYRYETVRVPAGTYAATTGADGRFQIRFPASAERSYEVTLSTADGEGRTSREQLYLSSAYEYPDYPQLARDHYDPYAVGSEVAVTFRQGREPQPSGGANRYLFYKAQNGIRSHAVTAEPRFAFAFAEADVPSVTVDGVRFTGSTYVAAPEPVTVGFDAETRRLDVAVAAGAGRYRPGEEAPLSIRVTDAAGRGVEAEVLLSAVDERIVRLQSESWYGESDILSDLYVWVPSGVLGVYAAHQRPSPDSGGGAEAGEGGDARSDFRDAALFRTVRTGPDGRAAVTFDLPDDLTSWRVSALALSGDLRAGSDTTLVPVGLPVFADVATSATYLTDDEPVLRLRAFGSALSAGDTAAFTVESPTLLDAPLTATGPAFTGVDVPLPLREGVLREGRHELTVRVEAKGQRDALVRPIRVVRSRLLRAETRHAEVADGERWEPLPAGIDGEGGGHVRVVVADHNRGRYHPELVNLSYTGGDRVDQALTRDLAEALLAEHFDEPALFVSTFRGAPYQTADGGVAILPFADDDLAVTARVAGLAADRFGRQDLARYLRAVLDDPDETRERAAVALYGLAGLGEPVLLEVQALAAGGDLSVRERLWAGLAAVTLGDTTTAGRLYRGLLAGWAQVRGEALRLNTGADQDDVLEATALAAVLGARLADGYAPALHAYAAGNRPTDVLTGLDRIAFLAAAVPRLSSEPVRLAYTLDGEREEATLARGATLGLSLTPDAIRALDLDVAEGRLGVAVTTLVPLDTAEAEQDPSLSVTRELPTTVQPDALVRIVLRPTLGNKAVDGCHRLTDLLPSGLRAVTQPYRLGLAERDLAYPYAVEGPRVSFCVTKGHNRPVVYYARVISPGLYTAEEPVLQSIRAPESIAFGNRSRLEIRP